MPKLYEGPWVFRTLLFVPSHIEKMVTKASSSEADCVVLDLEDAIPSDKKDAARQMIRQSLEAGMFDHRVVFVRINPIETGLTLKDLEGVACRQLDGFVYPMAKNADDIKSFHSQLSLVENQLGLEDGHFSMIPLIEAPEAALNALPIAGASSRVVGLLFGCEDYLAEIRGKHIENNLSLLTPRSLVALAARAVGIEPIDTPYVLDVHDQAGQRAFAEQGQALGMGGMLVMTPRQIPVAHDVYTPSTQEVDRARKIIHAADEAKAAGRGIVVVDGDFVSPPTVKDARKTLDRADSIAAMLARQA